MLSQPQKRISTFRPMSALGQKQTYTLQQAMSALHPIATAKATFRNRPCLLYPHVWTCAVQRPMRAFGAEVEVAGCFDRLMRPTCEAGPWPPSGRAYRTLQ